MKKRTPQEKKALSYARDRRNAYGEAPHAARKSIPLRKAKRNRANRHNADQQLAYPGTAFDEALADAVESQMKHRAPSFWGKYPDIPLSEMIRKKSGERAAMRTYGGRHAMRMVYAPQSEDTTMIKNAKFSDDEIEALRKAKILGVRAGVDHKFTGVWVVVVDGRVFVRSWNDKPTGWFRGFKRELTGTIQAEGLVLEVRGKTVRSARIRDAVTAAFAEKYPTKGSKKWVEGFAEPARVLTTLEFVPDPSSRLLH
ncbi:MAG TPA: DUF2255 family protein [Pyrinomonadaceae bacterium]|nr:DUF2255 family protein [Pyrinomonadaceae bacterium]